MSYVLSVDAGTTATKVCLFNEDGALISSHTQEYRLKTPTPLHVEIDAETLWHAFTVGVTSTVQQAKVQPADIVAIGISAQGETLIPVDKTGSPLRPAIVWLDNRAQDEANILDAEFNDGSSYQITGQVKIVPTWPAAKILWLKRNEKRLFDKVHKFLLVEDYLIYRMTGQYVCEGSLITSTAYWDIITEQWWDDMLQYLSIQADQLPEIMFSGQIVAELNQQAAKELRLSRQTVVTTGALDQVAGAIGVGNVQPGMFSENTGAALAICAPVENPIFDPQRQMPIHYFGIPHTYMAHTFTTGGMVYKWFRDTFCSQEIDAASRSDLSAYYLMDQAAKHVEAGCEGLLMLPHLQGAMAPEANPLAKGVFYGITLRHTKAHFIRAIMESIACTIKRNIDVLEKLGIRVHEIRSLGGGSKSPLWNQIKADLTQRTILTTEVLEEAACLGAAILAGKAVGLYKDIHTACEKMVHIKTRYDPNPKNFATYEKTYRRYVQLYENLCNMFSEQKTHH